MDVDGNCSGLSTFSISGGGGGGFLLVDFSNMKLKDLMKK